MSSNFGGPIAARSFVQGDYENRPETAHYQVTFKLINNNTLVEWELPGYVHVDGSRYSPFIKFMKNIFSLLIRESRI